MRIVIKCTVPLSKFFRRIQKHQVTTWRINIGDGKLKFGKGIATEEAEYEICGIICHTGTNTFNGHYYI